MNGVMSNQIGKLKSFYISKYYPEILRKVVYYDKEMNRTFVYLTNNMETTPEQVALLYKNRWQIELFFKRIKQHLKIKSFGELRKMLFEPKFSLQSSHIVLSQLLRLISR